MPSRKVIPHLNMIAVSDNMGTMVCVISLLTLERIISDSKQLNAIIDAKPQTKNARFHWERHNSHESANYRSRSLQIQV